MLHTSGAMVYNIVDRATPMQFIEMDCKRNKCEVNLHLSQCGRILNPSTGEKLENI